MNTIGWNMYLLHIKFGLLQRFLIVAQGSEFSKDQLPIGYVEVGPDEIETFSK